MLTLGVDTSSPATSIAIVEGGELRSLYHESHDFPPSDAVFKTLDELLKREGLALRDFDVFAASEGPGSFTGLRIGLGMVKTLAFALGKQVFGIDSVSAAAYGLVRSGLATGEFGVVIPGFKTTTFTGRFEAQEDDIRATSTLDYAESQDELSAFAAARSVPCFSPMALPFELPEIRLVELPHPPAVAIAFLAEGRARRGETQDFDAIQPRYLKPFNIGKKARRPEDMK